MKRAADRSDCPVNFAVEVLGDSWSLLIIRDMITIGASTFGDFIGSDERIGTSVLAQRLAGLERNGVIRKESDAADRRRTRYALTPAGIDLIPLLYDLKAWGTRTNPETDGGPGWPEALKLDRETVVSAWQRAVATGNSFYGGDESVIAVLGLSPIPAHQGRAARPT
jgi:DNA-binding HxlR family transcriptional regulator